MSNVRLTWTNSIPTVRQRALKHTLIEARVSVDLPWGVVNIVAVPAAELLIENVTPGDWEYRATEVDVGNVASARQPTVSVSVPFDAPSGVVIFVGAVES